MLVPHSLSKSDWQQHPFEFEPPLPGLLAAVSGRVPLRLQSASPRTQHSGLDSLGNPVENEFSSERGGRLGEASTGRSGAVRATNRRGRAGSLALPKQRGMSSLPSPEGSVEDGDALAVASISKEEDFEDVALVIAN
jgi:hypothetical protein